MSIRKKRVDLVSIVKVLIVFTLFLLSSSTLCASDAERTQYQALAEKKSMRVLIDYGGLRPSRTIVTTYTPGMSVLSLLEQVAKVKTYRIADFLFVRSVDGIESERGKMGWFYSIDGVSAKTVASSNLLKDAEEMQWSYRVEACY